MKKRLLFSTFALLAFGLSARAQFARLDRHPNVPMAYEAAFVDAVKGHFGNAIHSAYGQYFGQVDSHADIYGYGTFFTDQDGEVYGQFRRGEFVMGVKLNTQTAKVGSAAHYAVYDLMTGQMLYIVYNGDKYKPDAQALQTWKFMKIQYKNGAKYVGETVDGKRDGYGIYYYANGDYYYGRYEKGRVVGYGAMFRTNNTIVLQDWTEAKDAAEEE